MITKLNIEIYKENKNYCVYIGEDGSSGYECIGSTPENCAEQVKNYIINTFNTYENSNNKSNFVD